ncbi:A disintegrin and metalloproteinase with thrombospondin motifs 15 [Fasciolopsis buskii]|uniref:A disintegrin and metalloproteinase with thrombospondin motifs 15 n=1 Tax=Fasciolopsis buskii TaxID=27845 RepID=A0A8E0VDZ0_9TREM|nr:A disintegrin and metalloproteinase with thrombospondin motifs 15 [Fasciolopsis buski]
MEVHSNGSAMMLTSNYIQNRNNHHSNGDNAPFKHPLISLLRTDKPLHILPDPSGAEIKADETKHMPLMDSSGTVRMDQSRMIMMEKPDSGTSSSTVSSIFDRSHSTEGADLDNVDETAEKGYPVLSFQYVEPHTIELLVVVTERMTQRFGRLINDYLLSLLTTVSSLLRHPSLKTSLQLKIVDIMQLERNYAIRHNLDDWSYSKQEQVMSRFCRWVNRLRRPNFNWDSAILLNIGHFKSTALGVAHYRSMCNTESSCLAVLDRGFGTGYIIAHELGHQLGAKHDFEKNSDCETADHNYANEFMDNNTGHQFSVDHGISVDDLSQSPHYWQPQESPDAVRRDTIMSGTLYFDNFPLRWSACSRQAIHTFIETNGASCLRREDMPSALHAADWLAKRSRDDLPGLIFSLDQQCQFVLKIHATRFCGQLLPVCRQLYCQDAENGACLPMEAAWAEGSECGENKWCIQGNCVPTTQKPLRVNGNWGEWGPWSGCSRSCGGGVRFSERECNSPEPAHGGDFCHGTRTRMRSCAIHPCEKPINIRQELCDAVARKYGRQLGAYLPKLGEANACSLTCLDHGQAVHHAIKLPDGTPCYSQRDDICIKGHCWETGCDGVLGSIQRFDQCRVCGGDNSTCVKIKGVYKGESVNSLGIQTRGLINALRIPSGVTNAFVRKMSPRTTPYSSDSYDDYMLLIFEELTTQIRRGETREPFVGAELYYSGTRRAEEIVSITGRLRKDVNIMIKLENTETTRPPPTVEYHYYVDKSQLNSPLYFIAEEEALLASELANRRSGRSHSSSTMGDMPVQASSSPVTRSGTSRPKEMRTDRPRVHFVWRISELPSGCRTCAGNSTSYAECYPMVHDAAERQKFSDYDFYRPVAEYLCSNLPRPPPVVRRCADYCGVRWTAKPAASSTNELSERRIQDSCSARCGMGQQAAVHICEEYVVPAEEPDKTKGIWRPAQLGERACVKAGLGAKPKQPSSITCEGTCEPVFWTTTNWTECTAQCGQGERFRQIRCYDKAGREWPLHECIQSAESPAHAQSETGIMSAQEAQHALRKFAAGSQRSMEEIRMNTHLDQMEQCFEFNSECVSHLRWSASSWSDCEPLNDEMHSTCRSIEQPDSRRKTVLGVRQRQVTCHFSGSNLPKSLQAFTIGQGLSNTVTWPMQPELCRKASLMGAIQTEPSDRQACTRPMCYRWGTARMSKCSVTCGKGFRSATVPCERVTVDVSTTLHHEPTSEQNVPSWVEPVNLAECHQRLGYSPRIFISHDNQSLYVETVERAVQRNHLKQLTDFNPDHPIQLECFMERCSSTIPMWHTTSWSKCSVPCGTGIRRRQAICTLETQERNLDHRSPSENGVTRRLEAFSTVVTVNRMRVEVADHELCYKHNLPIPVEEEACFEGPCPQWVADDWGPCEGTCEYGVQHRTLRCVVGRLPNRGHAASGHPQDEPFHSPLFAASEGSRHRTRPHRSVQSVDVDPERCRAAGPQPVTKRLCLLSDGCPYWHRGDWSPCSVSCGIGVRTREVECRLPNGTIYHTNGTESNRFGIETSYNSAKQRFERAIDELTHVVESRTFNTFCTSSRPVDSSSCKTRPCTQNQPFWWSLMISECGSETCQVGRRPRVIRCLSSNRGPIDDSACRYLEKPSNWIPCVPFRCKQFEWRTDLWNPCPRECGLHMRYRRVHCVDHLGEEYSDTLCPAHLKPDNWRICPDICSPLPKNCAEVKQRYPGASDGTYQILLGHTPIPVYCADMETVHPSEYIILMKVNYARTAAFMQPSSSSDHCPYDAQPLAYEASRKSRSGSSIVLDTTAEAVRRQLTSHEVSAANCPDCPFVPNLASATYYQKLRLDVNTMTVDIHDVRFSYTVGSSPVPFATAKDCFGSTVCPQGRFHIDLRGTGLKVSTKTIWEGSSHDHVASFIHRSDTRQVIVGRCGGKCVGCWPRPGLYLEVHESEAKSLKITGGH